MARKILFCDCGITHNSYCHTVTVLYCKILYDIILYCFTLYYIESCGTIYYINVLYCTILNNIVLKCIMLDITLIKSFIPCYIIL